MSTIQFGSDSEWQLGTCQSEEIRYENYKQYIQSCCLNLGYHILTCINKRYPYGWGDGFIEIQGHRYCDDFMAYQLMQKIAIRSKISKH